MSDKSLETLRLASIQPGGSWKILHHRLFDVSPEVAGQYVGDGVTAWDLCFLQDLVLMENDEKGLLLDLGWYPHADPEGRFRLLVVRRLTPEEAPNPRSPYDWDNPVVDLKTRSVAAILREIHKVVTS